MLDELEPRFGTVRDGRLKILGFQAKRGVERDAAEGHYAAAPVPHGMVPLRLSPSPGSWAFAYARPGGLFSGGDVLAVEAWPLRDDDPSPIFPMNVVTTLSRPGPRGSG